MLAWGHSITRLNIVGELWNNSVNGFMFGARCCSVKEQKVFIKDYTRWVYVLMKMDDMTGWKKNRRNDSAKTVVSQAAETYITLYYIIYNKWSLQQLPLFNYYYTLDFTLPAVVIWTFIHTSIGPFTGKLLTHEQSHKLDRATGRKQHYYVCLPKHDYWVHCSIFREQ